MSDTETELPDPPPAVFDATAATFEAAVLNSPVPVVVDFHAAWCGPCRTLGPILEQLAAEAGGAWRLAKVDTDAEPDLAAAFQVSSLPLVTAFVDGKAVAEFVGLRSEAQVRAWLEPIVPDEAAKHAAAGDAVFVTDPAAAAGEYRAALALRPDFPAARTGLAAALLATGDHDGAAEQIAELEIRGFLEPAATRVKARLELSGGGSVEEAKAAAANPDDPAAAVALAKALAAAGDYDAALEAGLDAVRRFPGDARDAAKATLLRVFEVLGDDPRVGEYRRKLASALY